MKLEIRKAGINGEGIAYYRHKPVFIEGCFPGEIVVCKISEQGNYYTGELLKILKRSEKRMHSPCPYSHQCGGCALIELEYEEQLKIKKELLKEALYKYAGYTDDIPDVIGSRKQFHYRNKCNLPVIEADGKLVNALYKQKSNHPVVIENCLLHEEKLESIRKQCLRVLNENHCHGYDPKKKTGIRQLVIRGIDEEYQLTIITGKESVTDKMIHELSSIDHVCSIYQGSNLLKSPVQMMPEELKLLYGKEKIQFHLNTYALSLSPKAFFQLNRFQAENIYEKIRSLVKEKKKHIVEAYSGIGAISLYLSDRAEKITGIELLREAAKDANENASNNQSRHVRFVAGDAAEMIKRILRKEKIDLLVTDPPRTGLDQKMLECLVKSDIPEMIYVSCNPSTLAKDLSYLQQRYQIQSIQGYDMFPNTPLIETVVYLCRENRFMVRNVEERE